MEAAIVVLLAIIAAALVFGGAAVLGAFVLAGKAAFYTAAVLLWLAAAGGAIYLIGPGIMALTAQDLVTGAFVLAIVVTVGWGAAVLGPKLDDRLEHRDRVKRMYRNRVGR